MTPRAFLFDPNLCTGCHACALACGIENAPEAFLGLLKGKNFGKQLGKL